MSKVRNLNDTVRLNNGVEMPVLGFGTMPSQWGIKANEQFIKTVETAIKVGYRNIDTAVVYFNEAEVGEAIQRSIHNGTVKREELFISTKLWNTDRGYDLTLKAFDASMSRLGLDYLDLYLIHTPAVLRWHTDWAEINLSTWKAFERLYKEGRIRAIGVSNFLPHHLQSLMERADICPMVNQIEVHPGFNSATTVNFCKEHGIAIEAWGPFGNGQILTNTQLQKIASMYNKSVAQICLRWLLQKGIVPLPKSSNEKRIVENADVFDFELNESDMNFIDNMPPCGGFCVDADNAPENE